MELHIYMELKLNINIVLCYPIIQLSYSYLYKVKYFLAELKLNMNPADVVSLQNYLVNAFCSLILYNNKL